jgi:hypothetical protein
MAGQQELVEQLFDAALAIKPGDRHAFLEKVCGGDLELRRSVESLLVKDPRAGSSPYDPPPGFLDKTTVDIRKDIRDSSQISRDSDQVRPPADPQNRPGPGAVLSGRFLVVRFIARGGMGEVYEVENLHLQGVHIALKTILPQIAGEPHAKLAIAYTRKYRLFRDTATLNLARQNAEKAAGASHLGYWTPQPRTRLSLHRRHQQCDDLLRQGAQGRSRKPGGHALPGAGSAQHKPVA